MSSTMRCWPAATSTHLGESVVDSTKTFYVTETFGHLFPQGGEIFSQGVRSCRCSSPEVAELANNVTSRSRPPANASGDIRWPHAVSQLTQDSNAVTRCSAAPGGTSESYRDSTQRGPCPGRTPALGARRISRAERGSALLESYLDKSAALKSPSKAYAFGCFLSSPAKLVASTNSTLARRGVQAIPCLLFQVGCSCSTRTTVLKRIAAAATAAAVRPSAG